MNDKKVDNKKVKIVTLRQIIVVLIGLLIMIIMGIFGYYAGGIEFFHLSYTGGKGGYSSPATVFVIGLIIFLFGLYDILKSVYFLRTVKHKKR